MSFEGGIKVRILGDDSDLQKTLRESTVRIAKYGAAAAAAGAAVTAAFVARGLAAADAQAKLAGQLDTTSRSMATLSRAAGLSGVSFEKITSGTRQLTVRLSQAASGAGPAADMLERLGLSAEYLSSIPLDQRIDAINQAILENIPATERAAAGAALFGEEAGLAFRQISGDTLRQAAADAELFGTALTAIESRNVERAVDAMSNFTTAAQGASMQLAEELSPVLVSIGNEFRTIIEELGGVGVVAESAAEQMTTGMLFVIDAVAGVNRAFELAGNLIAGTFLSAEEKALIFASTLTSIVDGPVDALLQSMSAITGIELPELSNFTETLENRLGIVRRAIVEARLDLDEILMRPLPSESLREAIDLAREANDLMSAAAENDESSIAGPITLSDGFFDELEQIREHNAQKLAVEGEFSQHVLDEVERRENDLEALEKAKMAKRLGVAQDMFSNLSVLMNSENKKLFEIGKAAALANSVVNAYSAISSSYDKGAAIGGPILGAAFAATAATAQFAQIQAIRSTSYGSTGGASGSATQAVNDASAPVGGAGVNQSSGNGAQGPTTVINLSGDTFGRRQVRDLLEQLNEEGRNGGRLVIA